MRQSQENNENFRYISSICDKCFTFFKIISSLRLELLNLEPRKILLRKYAYKILHCPSIHVIFKKNCPQSQHQYFKIGEMLSEIGQLSL